VLEHFYCKFTTGKISGLSTTNHGKDHRNCHFPFSCHNGQPFSFHKIEKFKSQKVFKVLKIRFNSAILNGVITINHPYTTTVHPPEDRRDPHQPPDQQMEEKTRTHNNKNLEHNKPNPQNSRVNAY